jgi:hypothetical protein
MTERSYEQIEAEVRAAMDALRPHLAPAINDEDAARVFRAKHPELTNKLGEALLLDEIERMATEECERLVAAGKAEKVGPGEYRALPQR